MLEGTDRSKTQLEVIPSFSRGHGRDLAEQGTMLEGPEVLIARPVRRPPRAKLCILDDGAVDGEWVRIRTGRCVIGRTEGDVVIPDDDGISSRHVVIERRIDGGYHRWFLKDLASRNGTFVKVSQSRLADGTEVLLGMRRLKFELATHRPSATSADSIPRQSTQAFLSLAHSDAQRQLPSFVEQTQSGSGTRHVVLSNESWIGSATEQGAIALPNDPTLNPRHARVFKQADGRWMIADNNSTNGVWVRIEEISVNDACLFQLGEQQFLLKV